MKKTFTQLILLCVAVFAFNSANAQLNYLPGGFSTSGGTYTDLGTNGSVISVPDMDDAFSSALPIGFTFNFNGAPYDSFVFSTNGFIKLGRDSASRHFLFTSHAQPPANGPFTSTTTPTPLGKDSSMLFAFGQDLYPGSNAAEYRYYTSGAPGSQVCTIQWKNVKDKTQAAVGGLWDTINFQIKLYEGTNIIEYVYGKWTSTVSLSAARFSAVGIVGRSMITTNQNLYLVKGSTVVWSGTVANTGFYVNNAVNYRNPTSSPAGPAPDMGRKFTFVPLMMNDASVTAVYAQGRIALPFYNPDSIRANITNTGVNTLTGLTVTLDITGANTYTTTATIPSLAPNASINVAFAPFLPTNTGANLITVSVPVDDNTTNNQRLYSLSISNNRFGYTDTLLPASGGNGTTIAQFWGSRYFIAGSALVTKVYSPLASNSDAVNDTVCGIIMDSNGVILARSAPHIILASELGTTLVFTMIMPAQVTNQSVIAGIAGCNSVSGLNYFLGTSQTEVPIRPNTSFYFMSQTGAGGVTNVAVGTTYATPVAWTTTRLMMELGVEPLPPVDIGVSACGPVQTAKIPVNVAIPLRAVVKNFGTAARPAGMQVRYKVNNGPALGPITTTAALNPGDTTSVVFSGANSLTVPSAGTYTIKFYTSLSGDGLIGNDTLTVVYTAEVPATAPYRIANNIMGSWTLRTPTSTLWKQKTAVQPNGTSASTVLYADNYAALNTKDGYIMSPPINLTGTTNPLMHFYVANAPNTFTGMDDSLQVMVSTDGGFTFDPLYTKSSQLSSPTLGTDTPTSSTYTPAYAQDWRHECVDLSAYAGRNYVILAFRDKPAFGNGVHISDVTVTNALSFTSQTIYSSGTYTGGLLSLILSAAGSSNGELTIARYSGNPYSTASPVFATNTTATTNNLSTFTPNNASNTHWYTITYSGIGTGNYPQSVPYSIYLDANTIPGINSMDSVYIMKRCDFTGSWVPISTNASVGNLYTGTVTGFSDITIGSMSSVNPLPVKWLNVNGTNKDDYHNLISWATASESNTAYFILERSYDNSLFTECGKIAAAGNSEKVRRYSLTDELTEAFGKPMYYRIRQIDMDGAYTYSRTVRLAKQETSNLPEITVANPFTAYPVLRINQVDQSTTIKVRITDLSGKTILEKELEVTAGTTLVNLEEMTEQSRGIYLMEVSQNGQTIWTQKVVKQ